MGRNVPLYVLLFLVSGYMFPLSVVTTEEWEKSHGVLWKLFYMMPIFFNFRMRIYAGFTLSECACIMLGLGAYPECSDPRPGQGPSKPEMLTTAGQSQLGEINFETVHNIDEWGSDFVPSMREALRCWNMTVQHWLVFIVYKRFPIKSLRTGMVMSSQVFGTEFTQDIISLLDLFLSVSLLKISTEEKSDLVSLSLDRRCMTGLDGL